MSKDLAVLKRVGEGGHQGRAHPPLRTRSHLEVRKHPCELDVRPPIAPRVRVVGKVLGHEVLDDVTEAAGGAISAAVVGKLQNV